LKKITLTFILLSIGIIGFSQTNFYKFSVGAGAGGTLAFADVAKKTIAFAGYGTLDYQITPFVGLGLEVQKGELAGGDILLDPFNRQFINSYFSWSANLKVQMGEFLTSYQLRNDFLNNIRGLYLGVGFGYIKNTISNVRYYGDNFYPGADKSSEGIVPINLGINFYLPDKWGYQRFVINANLQSTIVIGEGLDGYGHGAIERNDIYSFLSAGIKYNFGSMGLDKRR
jgi:hypothetical protein